jgi:hypothetical protein
MEVTHIAHECPAKVIRRASQWRTRWGGAGYDFSRKAVVKQWRQQRGRCHLTGALLTVGTRRHCQATDLRIHRWTDKHEWRFVCSAAYVIFCRYLSDRRVAMATVEAMVGLVYPDTVPNVKERCRLTQLPLERQKPRRYPNRTSSTDPTICVFAEDLIEDLESDTRRVTLLYVVSRWLETAMGIKERNHRRWRRHAMEFCGIDAEETIAPTKTVRSVAPSILRR